MTAAWIFFRSDTIEHALSIYKMCIRDRHIPEYQAYYARKYAEVTTHNHKRSLALTSRKFVRLVFGLLAKNQLYTGEKPVSYTHLDVYKRQMAGSRKA